LLTAVFAHEAGAAMGVRTYWAWETTATLRLLGGARVAEEPTGRRGQGHIVSPRAQLICVKFAVETFAQVVTGFLISIAISGGFALAYRRD